MAQSKMRVVSFTNDDFTGFQLLQQKTMFGWRTIDREDVPADVKISLASVGDTGGWVSKFTEKGTFGRDGTFKPHPKPAEYGESYEPTPRLLKLMGKQPFRKYVRMMNIGGDFSYWIYADSPTGQ
jgi:hypothetical protein